MRNRKVIHIAEPEIIGKMHAILQNADDYFFAYEALKKHNSECFEKGNVGRHVFTADIVNLAFAIELYMKALLYGAGLQVKGHKFNELYSQLSENTQSDIKQAFQAHLLKKTGIGRDIFGISFEDRLAQYSDTFQKWRYCHEERMGSYHSEFCENLVHVLRNMAHTKLGQLFRSASSQSA